MIVFGSSTRKLFDNREKCLELFMLSFCKVTLARNKAEAEGAKNDFFSLRKIQDG